MAANLRGRLPNLSVSRRVPNRADAPLPLPEEPLPLYSYGPHKFQNPHTDPRGHSYSPKKLSDYE